MKEYIPILKWLPNYKQQDLRGDLSAGITVGVMLIPQGMAYSMLAGMPPIYGLYASILPLLLYAVFGTSRQLAVGPVAMVSLLIAAGVGTIAEVGSDLYIQLAILLALMVGLIQFLMGVFRLGFLVNFLSHPVVSGFTSAAALIIGFSQLKHLLGIEIQRSNHIHEILFEAFKGIGGTNLYTLAIGVIAIGIILMIKRFKLKIPGPLVAVVFGILAVWVFRLDLQQVKIVGTVPDGLPIPAMPIIAWEHIKSLLPIAMTISFISFMESIAVAKAIQSKHKDYEIVPNQELIALGMANIGGSFLQAFPTTGGFSRTAVNDQAGAKTGLAAVFSAVLIMLTLLFLTPLFYFLPKAILASVIMVAVFGLIDFKEAFDLWKHYRPDFWMLIATFLGTLLLGIEEGVLIGIGLSLARIVYQTTKPHIAVLGKIPEKSYYKNVNRFEDLEVRKDILIVRFDARLYYANVSYFLDELKLLIEKKGTDLTLFILDADSMNGIDSTGVHALEELATYCRSKKLQFYMAEIKGPVRDILHRCDFFEKIGEEHFFLKVQHGVDAYDKKLAEEYSAYTLQTNEPKEVEE